MPLNQHSSTVGREQENNGIVQKFEEPTSPYNTLIRAYWTPHKVFYPGKVIGPFRTWYCIFHYYEA